MSSRIVITEIDNTSPGVVLTSSFDVAYIPGFVDPSNDSNENVLTAFNPTLFTSVADFKKACGDEPYTYGQAVTYDSNWATVAYKDEQSKLIEANAEDPAYLYAVELLTAGIPVLYERVNGLDVVPSIELFYSILSGITSYPEFSEGAVYAIGDTVVHENVIYKAKVAIVDPGTFNPDSWDKVQDAPSESIYEKFSDIGEFSIKYLTSGGYPVFEYSDNAIAKKMLAICAARGDAYALIDHTNYPERPLDPTNRDSVYRCVIDAFDTDEHADYGTVMTPWLNVFSNAAGKNVAMPASYAYLVNKAYALQSGGQWLSVAGVTRGLVRNFGGLAISGRLSNKIADTYQPRDCVAINAITDVKPYGYCIWGNRTLKNNSTAGNLTATSFLNLRDIICDVKKQCLIAARKFMFEQNSDILWINFTSLITPTLDKMKGANVLSGYSIKKLATSEKGKLCAKVVLYPIYAVENFEIVISIEDDEVSVD